MKVMSPCLYPTALPTAVMSSSGCKNVAAHYRELGFLINERLVHTGSNWEVQYCSLYNQHSIPGRDICLRHHVQSGCWGSSCTGFVSKGKRGLSVRPTTHVFLDCMELYLHGPYVPQWLGASARGLLYIFYKYVRKICTLICRILIENQLRKPWMKHTCVSEVIFWRQPVSTDIYPCSDCRRITTTLVILCFS
jgi:hypothetical protein